MTTHDFDVPVKTYVTFEVYRALQKLADEHDTTVSVLVAVAARQAVTPRKRKYVTMTPTRFRRLCELTKTGMTIAEIATEMGLSRSTVYNHLQRARSSR